MMLRISRASRVGEPELRREGQLEGRARTNRGVGAAGDERVSVSNGDNISRANNNRKTYLEHRRLCSAGVAPKHITMGQRQCVASLAMLIFASAKAGFRA
jgi:hypothetical protein